MGVKYVGSIKFCRSELLCLLGVGWIILSRYEKIMSVKLTYGYLTKINCFQYFLVFNLYRRMNKFEYISENSHTVVSESCLYYLIIENVFNNFHLFDLQWTIWMYCNVADFYHVTFAFRRADFYNEIPSISSQEENPSPQRSGSLVFLYYLLISFVISLLHARENYTASIKRDDVLLFS